MLKASEKQAKGEASLSQTPGDKGSLENSSLGNRHPGTRACSRSGLGTPGPPRGNRGQPDTGHRSEFSNPPGRSLRVLTPEAQGTLLSQTPSAGPRSTPRPLGERGHHLRTGPADRSENPTNPTQRPGGRGHPNGSPRTLRGRAGHGVPGQRLRSLCNISSHYQGKNSNLQKTPGTRIL